MNTQPNKRIVEDVYVEIYGGEMTDDEVKAYLAHLRTTHKNHTIESLSLTIDGDFVDMKFRYRPEPFERLRRITGYLTSDLKFWNNAKQAEERDRVKHI